jgi:hypothetical protein
MNREDIIRMAQEAWGEGKVYRFDSPKHWPEVEEMFVRFANLVAAAEREACAKVCENIGVNIELSRRMAAVKVSNFYGSIIKDAEKEIEKLHGIYAAAIRTRGAKK